MFIYVFSESDYAKMRAAGFQYICRDEGAKAFVFLSDSAGTNSIPEGIEKVVTTRLAFNGAIGDNSNGGGRHGAETVAAL